MKTIQHLIYTNEVESSSVVQLFMRSGVTCIPVLDTRSAVYYATGICAQSGQVVAVCVDGGNASRSAFSGMTEAFYRQLPVMLITLGCSLDYSTQLRDVVMGHYVVTSTEDILRYQACELPIHIELQEERNTYTKVGCPELQCVLKEEMSEKDYLYFSPEIQVTQTGFACKCVNGGMPGCEEGTLANVLGASLAGKRRRYVGVLTEAEFLHDMNTLGNIHANDRLLFIVLSDGPEKLIEEYAGALHYVVWTGKEKEFCCSCLKEQLENGKKTVLILSME